MKGVFSTILAVLFGLAFEEFYADTAMPREHLARILSALPLAIVPWLFTEALLFHAKRRLRAGHPLDSRRFAPFVASAALPIYVIIVFVCRWPMILVPLGLEGTILVDHLVVLAPFFVVQGLCLVESLRLRRPLVYGDGQVRAATLPEIRAPLVEQLRQLGLMLAPLFGLIFILDLANDTFLRAYVRKLPIVALGFLLFLLVVLALGFPEVFRITMRLKKLVPGAPLRLRLDELSNRLGFRCRDVLYWPTSRPVMNALIIGTLPRYRYVVLTDELCQRLTLDEICAVFAHEVGHGKRWHALYYLLLSATFLALLLPIGDYFGEEISAWTGGRIDVTLATTLFIYLPAFALFWRLALDTLSKRFELEADVFGLEAVRDPQLFINTLDKVARLAKLDRRKTALRHFSIEGRVDFLRQAFVERDTGPLERFRAKIERTRKAIVTASILGILFASIFIGYQSLHGLGSILLDHRRDTAAESLAKRLLDFNERDFVAVQLLSETEIYLYADHGLSSTRFAETLKHSDEITPVMRSELDGELESAWIRALLRGRPDVALEMLDRRERLNRDPSDDSDHFDPYLPEQIAEWRHVTEAVERRDLPYLKRLLDEEPRWLRRPDLRCVADHLANLVRSHKDV